jgi:hypothetical protein
MIIITIIPPRQLGGAAVDRSSSKVSHAMSCFFIDEVDSRGSRICDLLYLASSNFAIANLCSNREGLIKWLDTNNGSQINSSQ